MKMYGGTDIGLVRATNQDSYYIDKSFRWAVVADGMGGHNGGETASAKTVEEIKKAMSRKNGLVKAIERANTKVYNMAMENPELLGMGTTVVLCEVSGGKASIAHVGDSRAYLLREGKLQQITKDHSIVQQLIDMGTITVEQAKYHPQKNFITRAVGTEKVVDIDFSTVEINENDAILVCSDGLCSYVDEDVIVDIIQNNSEEDVVGKLIAEANENGGKDNVTVVYIKA